MSTPDQPSLADAGYHWTTHKAGRFLGALAEFGRVGEAARAVGMSRQSAYKLRARVAGGLFAKLWDRAQAEGKARREAGRRVARKATPLAPESDVFGLGR